MPYINEESTECTKSELDLFAIHPTQTAIESSFLQELKPVSAIQNGGPFEFVIESSSEDFIDPTSLLVYAKIKVTRENGAPTQGGDVIALENNALHTLFSQVDVTLGGTVVSSSDQLYHHRAYMESVLSYGKDARDSFLRGEGLTFPNNFVGVDAVAERVTARASVVNPSPFVEYFGRLRIDIAAQDRLLPNNSNIRIKLTRNKREIFFNTAAVGDPTHFEIEIADVSLLVRKVKVGSPAFLAISESLLTKNAKYPIKRVVMKTYTISQGSTSNNKEGLFGGVLPRRIVLGLVANAAFNGQFHRSAFNYQHFHLNSLSVQVDGNIVTGKPLQMNFDDGLFTKAFLHTYNSMGKYDRDEGCVVSLDNFARGFALFAFDLTPDKSQDACHLNLVHKGSISLDLSFTQALPETVNVVCLAEYESVIEVDNSRNFQIDW